MVETVGSMEIRGVYKDDGLQRNLDKTNKELGQTKQEGGKVNTSFGRMRTGAVALGGAIAMVGTKMLDWLVQSAMQSPYLAGQLSRIGTESKLLGWEMTRGLEPALETFANMLSAIRKEDAPAFVDELEKIKNFIIEDWATMKVHKNWLAENLGFAGDVWDEIVERVSKWAGDIWNGFIERAEEILPSWVMELPSNMKNWLSEKGNLVSDTVSGWFSDAWSWIEDNTPESVKNFINSAKDTLSGWKNTIQSAIEGLFDVDLSEFGSDAWNSFVRGAKSISLGGMGGALFNAPSKQVGGYIPTTGLYNLHAGERVVPAGRNNERTQRDETTVNISFDGANFNLASGIDIDRFVDDMSRRMADKQRWSSY